MYVSSKIHGRTEAQWRIHVGRGNPAMAPSILAMDFGPCMTPKVET